MKASELIRELNKAIKMYGDVNVFTSEAIDDWHVEYNEVNEIEYIESVTILRRENKIDTYTVESIITL